MACSILNLIKTLQTKDQDREVEFIIIDADGMIVAMDLEGDAYDMAELLKMFPQGGPK